MPTNIDWEATIIVFVIGILGIAFITFMVTTLVRSGALGRMVPYFIGITIIATILTLFLKFGFNASWGTSLGIGIPTPVIAFIGIAFSVRSNGIGSPPRR